jgi:hypothetical protein
VPDLFAPTSLLIVSGVLALVLPLVRRLEPLRRWSLDRFARRVDLPVPDHLRPRIGSALARRTLAVDLGGLAGIAVLGAAGWLLGTGETIRTRGDAAGSLWPLVAAGAAFAGAAIGAGLSGARQAAREAGATGPRIARPTAPTFADYVAPLELWGARLGAATPALLFVVGVAAALPTDVVTTSELVTTGALLAVTVPVIVLIGSELAGRRLLDLPQVAGSSLELAWSDVIRARMLRDIITAPLAIGVYATFALLAGASGAIQDDVVANAVVGAIGLATVAVVMIAIVSVASRPQRHFRHRLWPRDGGAYPSAGPAATGTPR